MSAGGAPEPEPLLDVVGLTCSFGGPVPALRDVHLRVPAGTILGVVGASGCGKTTLLRLIAGLEVPGAGVIRLGGRNVAGGGAWVPPERRGVGLVFQDFALFPHYTARRNVEYGLAGVRREERRERADRFLDLVGLEGLGERYPHQLSGGQQQRVALARALAPGPDLLLLDEPFSNLDAVLKRTLRRETARVIRSTGTTAILVAHDPADIRAVADRAAVMRGGAVLQEGTPDELTRDPTDAYVAELFGAGEEPPRQGREPPR